MAFKNLIVSGCSFTEDTKSFPSWATYVNEYFRFSTYINVAKSGAGNFYICNSIIDIIQSSNYLPDETLVLVMWSGPGRIDLRVAYDILSLLDYNYRQISYELDKNYLFSGGLPGGASWDSCPATMKIFESLYLNTDHHSLVKDTLMHILNLENFLLVNKIKFQFMSYTNIWDSEIECNQVGEPTVGYFAKGTAALSKINFDNWIFADNKKNCIFEYAKHFDLLGLDKFHPADRAHKKFAHDIVVKSLIDKFHL